MKKLFVGYFVVLLVAIFLQGCGGSDGSTTLAEITTTPQTVWQQSGSQIYMDWDAANEYCAGLTEGGYDDWVLPSIETLRSLIVCSNGTQVAYGPDNLEGVSYCGDGNLIPFTSPTIDSIFPNFATIPIYWSSTSADNPGDAWYVNFSDGTVGSDNNKAYYGYTRCVRNTK